MIRMLLLTAVLAAASPTPPPQAVPGGYTRTDVHAADLKPVVAALTKELAQPAWLGAPVKAGAIAEAERQVVAGLNYRLALPLTWNGVTREGRAVIYQDLHGRLRLTSVTLAPQGAPLLGEPPSASDMPGGYIAQPVRDPEIKASAAKAVKLLAEPGWLGRSVQLVGLTRAATQVVAGTNTFLLMQVKVGGVPRTIGAVLFEDFQGHAELSWVQLTAP